MDMKKLLQAMDGISTKPVEGSNDMKKFVSIIQEGANPHKVALPVQMAMNHYQTAVKPAVRKDRLIDKYFTEAETAITQRKEEKRAMINQYASIIAERVLMKESKLEERSTSEKQARTMAAAAHNPEFAKKVGIKTSVAKEFNQKDKGTALLSNAMKGKTKKVKEAGEAGWGRTGMTGVGLQPIDELSTELLGRYKKAAGADAKAADAAGDFERGNKRFKGINKATIKQFDNDAKKHKELAESRTDYTAEEMADMLTGKRTQKQVDADAEKTRGPDKGKPKKESLDQLLALRDKIDEAIKQRLDPKCWKGKHKEGTKIKGGVRVNNCVPNKK